MRRRQRRPIIIILNVFISRGVYRVSQIYIQCTLSYWKALTATAKFQSILFSSFAVVCRETTGSLPDKVYYIYIYSLYCSFNLCVLESVVEFLLFFVVQRVPVLWSEREGLDDDRAGSFSFLFPVFVYLVVTFVLRLKRGREIEKLKRHPFRKQQQKTTWW